MQQIRSEENTRQGAKVDRYKWLTSDSPGQFMMLDKRLLRIDGGDEGYQRDATNARVLKLSRDWSWVACGVLIVALRPNGWYFVMDGQHRKLAADKRSDIQMLPCMVFKIEDRALEAAGFLRANRERRPPRTIEQFKARLEAGDKTAATAEQFIRDTGRVMSINSSATTFSCVASLCRAIEEDEGALRRLWPLLNMLCHGEAFHSTLLDGLFYIEARTSEDLSLTTPRFRKRIAAVGYKGLLTAAGEAAAFYAKGGPKVWARGIHRAINARLRAGRLQVFDDEG